MARLASATSRAWVDCVMRDFDSFLADHASCERKAAAMAMALVSRYPDRHELVDAMISLAREELEHFHATYRLLAERGISLAPDVKDLYVGGLHALRRHAPATLLLDRLLIAGVVEARGCERFGLIAETLQPGALKDFYLDITRSEARHGGLFVRLARLYYPHDIVEQRLAELFEAEARIVADLPLRPALH